MPEPTAPSATSLADIDRLVHEPARLLILGQLYVVESADFLFIRQRTGLTQGNLSSHMSRLEAEGYLEVEKDFVGKRPRTMLRLSPSGRAAFEDYLSRMKSFLDGVTDRGSHHEEAPGG